MWSSIGSGVVKAAPYLALTLGYGLKWYRDRKAQKQAEADEADRIAHTDQLVKASYQDNEGNRAYHARGPDDSNITGDGLAHYKPYFANFPENRLQMARHYLAVSRARYRDPKIAFH